MGLNQFLLVAMLLAIGSSQPFAPGASQLFIPGSSQPLGPVFQSLYQSGGSQPVQVVPVDVSVQTGSSSQAPAGLQMVAPVQTALNVQSGVQGPVRPLTWRFPIMPPLPAAPEPVAVSFDLPVPALPQSVAAVCTEKVVHVEVKQDLFGTGEAINLNALSLGGCGPVAQDPALQILIFQSELQNCGSNLIVTESELVYIFTLIYGSPQSSSPIVRSAADSGATFTIECHYPRFHNVSSNPLVPFWIPHASVHVAEEQLVFSLRLMIENWVSERSSNQYSLGETINIEASVVQYHHAPLRVTVESCVATSVPDVNSLPRYFFITNDGCFVDSKLTGGKSQFLPQTAGNVLGLQLEAFQFQQANTSTIFFACWLEATSAAFAPTADTKACSFSGNGWFAAYGDHSVCACCDGNCSARKRRDVSDHALHVKRRVNLGPIVVVN